METSRPNGDSLVSRLCSRFEVALLTLRETFPPTLGVFAG